MHVGQPEVTALIGERESQVINPHQVQDRGVEIVHMHLLLRSCDLVAVVVGRSPREPWLDPRPGEERCEAPGMVIAAVIGGGERAL